MASFFAVLVALAPLGNNRLMGCDGWRCDETVNPGGASPCGPGVWQNPLFHLPQLTSRVAPQSGVQSWSVGGRQAELCLCCRRSCPELGFSFTSEGDGHISSSAPGACYRMLKTAKFILQSQLTSIRLPQTFSLSPGWVSQTFLSSSFAWRCISSSCVSLAGAICLICFISSQLVLVSFLLSLEAFIHTELWYGGSIPLSCCSVQAWNLNICRFVTIFTPLDGNIWEQRNWGTYLNWHSIFSFNMEEHWLTEKEITSFCLIFSLTIFVFSAIQIKSEPSMRLFTAFISN